MRSNRAIAASPPSPNDTGVAELGTRPNLLPWTLLLCGAVLLADLLGTWQAGVNIGYVLAVTLALGSNRTWHILAVAAVSAVLLLGSPLLPSHDGISWQQLEAHIVTVFAIVLTALFGSATLRKSQAESRALAEAAQSRLETTELRQALERAEAAEAARRAMVDRLTLANRSAGVSTWEWDLKTNQVSVHEGTAFAARVGATHLEARSYDRYVHPEALDAYRQAFMDAFDAAGGQDHFSHRYRFAMDAEDGMPRYIQMHGRILRSKRGRAYRVLGVDWEVTDEEATKRELARQAEQLRIAQTRLERAIGGTQDALFEVDFSNGTLWHSRRLLEMLGEPDTIALTTETFHARMHPDDREHFESTLDAQLTKLRSFDLEFRLIGRNGEPLWMRARGQTEHAPDGRPLLLAGSISDITEALAAREATIRAAQEAEAASLAKSTFLATMSHEIRTPMNGIIGMTGLLLDSNLDRVQRDCAETIRASADSLLTILNDVLDFSKIEAGKLDIESIELDLVNNVEDVGAIMAFQAAAKGLELIVDVRPEVPARVLGDPQRIRQCLLNLVGNAIKFTHAGEVVIEVCCIGRQDGKALVHFEVRDTGVGIEPQVLDKLFQPFTQADSSTTRKFGGTGLGLSIVHKLVERMGGRTGAQSVPGQGSTFWFTLPLETLDGLATSVYEPAARTGARVLLVDDNETNCRVLAGQMSHAGYEVRTASCARDALEHLRRPDAAFDVVVLDYQMPDMDGAVLGEQIAGAPDIRATRLVLLTSLDRAGDMQRCAELGFSAYLTKPVRTRELLECLNQALAHGAQDWYMRSQPIITRNSLLAADLKRQYTGRVLLVEDNAINQRVAHRFLERLGCQVHVAADGLQAVEAYQRERFDFILMDMQMPVMDGLEATRRIRELETAGARTPIVALTANAMMGTLERCLEAGMDDYLTKPLDIARLQDVLDRLLTAQAPRPVHEAPCSDSTLVDRLREIAGDDAGFIHELIEAFVTSGRETIHELQTTVCAQDFGATAAAAHKLKGASANLHLERLMSLAQTLETDARAGRGASLAGTLDKIAMEFQRAVAALQAAEQAQLDRAS